MQLTSLIDPAYVLLGVEAENWRDAVRRACEPMVAAGAFAPAYVDDIIAAAEDIGPYFVLTRGVALPHGLPETGVLAPALGICRLAEPVEFGSAANDPVRYVLAFGSADPEEHLEALTLLTELIGDAAFFETIDTASSPDPVLAYVRRAETAKEEV